jgi:hypothetical protein
MRTSKRASSTSLSIVAGPISLVSSQGKDLSGSEFLPSEIHGGNFFEAIFNGCRFNGIQARQSVFQHTEFTEASLRDCVFEDTSFDHSDFVLSTVTDTVFVRCSFQNAEWRDAVFERVQFRQCIFRNTTVSLVHFRSCDFDDASAANLVGASKRYCLFSATSFRLPPGEISFLKANFGIEHNDCIELPATGDDPLFEMAVRRYARRLSEQDFYHLVRAAFARITASPPHAERLRLRYLAEVCRMLIREKMLSVFTIKLLDTALAKEAERARDSEQGLQIFGLILAVRVSLRERVATLEHELTDIPERMDGKAAIAFEFENTYQRRQVDLYLAQMATFCHLRATDLKVRDIRSGSTFVDAVLAASAPLREIVRFIRYSLATASVVLREARKVRKSYQKLASGEMRRSSPRKRARKPTRHPESLSAPKTIDAIVGRGSEETKQIEIFVDQSKEQIFVVGGRVRVTVSYVD